MFRSSLLRKFAANFLLAAMTVNLFSAVAVNAATTDFGMTVDAGPDYTIAINTIVPLEVAVTGVDSSLAFATPAIVNWGDGSADESVSVLPNGADFSVVASHMYSVAGSYTASVTVTTQDGLNTVTDQVIVDVLPPPTLTVSAGFDKTANVGDLVSIDAAVLFYVSMPAPVTVDWGDGQSELVMPVDNGTFLSVPATHTYLNPGDFIVRVTAADMIASAFDELVVFVQETDPATLPDLQIDSIVYDYVGGDFDVTVSNKSTATAEVPADANLYLQFSYTEDLNVAPALPADTQEFNKTMSTSGLPVGGTLTADTVNELESIAQYPLSTSTCTAYVLAVIDNVNDIEELTDATSGLGDLNSEDNYYRATIDLCPEVDPEPTFAPDLFLSINSFIEDWMLSYTIGNKGTEAVDPALSATGVNHFYLNDSELPFTKAPWRTHPYDFIRYSAVGGSADRVIFPYYYEDFATLAPGVNTITICVDATDVVLEEETVDASDVADLDNNCDTFAFDWDPTQAPDLVSEVISASAADDVVTYTVGNLSQMGVVDYIGSYTVSVNGVLALDQRWALDADTTYLDAAGSVTRTLSVSLELGDEVEVCMDATDVILVELSEANNCASFVVTADEVVVDPAAQANLVPSSIQREVGNVLSFIVSNNGLADIDPSSDPSYVVYNNDLVVAEGSLRAAAGDGFLSMGSSSVAQLTLGSTSDSAYTVCVDYSNDASRPDGVVAESNEGDNCLTEILATPPTDGGDTGTGTGGTDDADAPTTDTGSTGGSGPRVTGGGLPVGGSDRDSVILSGSDDNSEDVTLTEEEIVVCGTMTFVDVPEDNSDYDSIYRGWCEGIINGKDPLHFAPSDFIKRDEVTKIVSRVFGFVTIPHEDLEKVTEAPYSDVSTDEVLAYYVETMTEEGFFVEEELADEFRPHEDMTYGEIVDFVSEVNGSEVSMEGYEETDSVTRGSFMTFVFSLFE